MHQQGHEYLSMNMRRRMNHNTASHDAKSTGSFKFI